VDREPGSGVSSGPHIRLKYGLCFKQVRIDIDSGEHRDERKAESFSCLTFLVGGALRYRGEGYI
jgi:hypothetical protein